MSTLSATSFAQRGSSASNFDNNITNPLRVPHLSIPPSTTTSSFSTTLPKQPSEYTQQYASATPQYHPTTTPAMDSNKKRLKLYALPHGVFHNSFYLVLMFITSLSTVMVFAVFGPLVSMGNLILLTIAALIMGQWVLSKNVRRSTSYLQTNPQFIQYRAELLERRAKAADIVPPANDPIQKQQQQQHEQHQQHEQQYQPSVNNNNNNNMQYNTTNHSHHHTHSVQPMPIIMTQLSNSNTPITPLVSPGQNLLSPNRHAHNISQDTLFDDYSPLLQPQVGYVSHFSNPPVQQQNTNVQLNNNNSNNNNNHNTNTTTTPIVNDKNSANDTKSDIPSPGLDALMSNDSLDSLLSRQTIAVGPLLLQTNSNRQNQQNQQQQTPTQTNQQFSSSQLPVTNSLLTPQQPVVSQSDTSTSQNPITSPITQQQSKSITNHDNPPQMVILPPHNEEEHDECDYS